MRLIDADLLMDNLGFFDTEEEREENVGQIITWEDVDRLPTAYDVDDVVEQLEQEYSKALRHYNEDKGTSCSFSSRCRLDAYKKAIEIVKGGGIDE